MTLENDWEGSTELGQKGRQSRTVHHNHRSPRITKHPSGLPQFVRSASCSVRCRCSLRFGSGCSGQAPTHRRGRRSKSWVGRWCGSRKRPRCWLHGRRHRSCKLGGNHDAPVTWGGSDFGRVSWFDGNCERARCSRRRRDRRLRPRELNAGGANEHRQKSESRHLDGLPLFTKI